MFNTERTVVVQLCWAKETEPSNAVLRYSEFYINFSLGFPVHVSPMIMIYVQAA
jgi:hypothetical protein